MPVRAHRGLYPSVAAHVRICICRRRQLGAAAPTYCRGGVPLRHAAVAAPARATLSRVQGGCSGWLGEQRPRQLQMAAWACCCCAAAWACCSCAWASEVLRLTCCCSSARLCAA